VSAIDDRHDISTLRERRRRARRRRGIARLDAALALAGAIVVLLATPGLAIAALTAFALLVVCGTSLVWERVARRRAAPAQRQAPAPSSGEPRRRR
jgi:Flp pilus assembly protein TadB